jgi:hypothetical protein
MNIQPRQRAVQLAIRKGERYLFSGGFPTDSFRLLSRADGNLQGTYGWDLVEGINISFVVWSRRIDQMDSQFIMVSHSIDYNVHVLGTGDFDQWPGK